MAIIPRSFRDCGSTLSEAGRGAILRPACFRAIAIEIIGAGRTGVNIGAGAMSLSAQVGRVVWHIAGHRIRLIADCHATCGGSDGTPSQKAGGSLGNGPTLARTSV